METIKIYFQSTHFNIEQTLTCGQIFRYFKDGDKYFVLSKDKVALLYYENDNTVIECEKQNKEYFTNFFDLDRDYSLIYNSALNSSIEVLVKGAQAGKGIRILNQEKQETLFCFLISQNNNIPRIKKSIESICSSLGQKIEFLGKTFYSFPSIMALANASEEFYKSVGLGYRAQYFKSVAKFLLDNPNYLKLDNLSTNELKTQLVKLKGIGPKVADCITLFAYHRSDSFPVDTWIEKVYKQDLNGSITDRDKISGHLVSLFGENAGYFQQYLFYYKRSIEKNL